MTVRTQLQSAPTARDIIPRSDQLRLADEVSGILESSKFAYLEAPTGAGKSLTMGLIADRLEAENPIILAHSLDILEQLRGQLEFYTALKIIEPRNWTMMTWQRFARLHRNQPGEDEKHPLIFVDECHIGGVTTYDRPKIAFPAIRAAATKIVWVSATPWQLDEKLMGKREEHTAFLSYPDAHDNGLINQAQLVRVDCGLELRLAVQRLEQSAGRPLHRLIDHEFSVRGDGALGTYDELSDRIRELTDRDLTIGDVKDLARHRFLTMAGIYKRLHRGEKAIFWLPNQQLARECAEHLNEQLGEGSAAAITASRDSGEERKLMDTAITRFKSASDPLKIACVVYRLREGFDFDELAFGFDCSWNPANYRNSIQKIGRLIRTARRKPQSRYYYAVDVMTVAAAHNRAFSQKFLGQVSELGLEDPEFTAAALADAAGYIGKLGTADAIAIGAAQQGKLATGRGQVPFVSYPLFKVTYAAGHTIAATLSLGELFDSRVRTDDIDARLDALITGIEQGAPRPAYMTPDYRFMHNYIHPSGRLFRPWARELLNRCNAIVSMEQRSTRAKERLERLVAEVESTGTMPSHTNPDGIFLAKYLKQTYSGFRPDLRARVIACGAFRLVTFSEESVDTRLERIMAEIEKTGEVPKRKTPDSQLLSSCMTPSGTLYRPHVRTRMIELGLLTPRATRPANVDRTLERIISAIEAGGPKPAIADKDDKFMRAHLSNPATPARHTMRQRLIAIGALIPYESRRATNAERLEILLAAIEAGAPMPQSRSADARWLRSRITPAAKTFSPDARDRLIACGAIVPLEDRTSEIDTRLEAIVAAIEQGGPKPLPKSDDDRLVRSCIAPSSGMYRAWARERLVASGHYQSPADKRNAVTAKLETMIAKIERGMAMPTASSRDGAFLRSYATKASSVYRPEVRERLLKCGAIYERAHPYRRAAQANPMRPDPSPKPDQAGMATKVD